MRTLLLTTAAVLAMAGSVFAQTPAPAASAALTLDSPIQDIAANPAGKAILDKDLPGLTSHPAYDQFKAMSLKDVAPMSNGAISDAALAKTGADLAALPK